MLVGFPVRQFQMYKEQKVTDGNLNYLTNQKVDSVKKVGVWVDEQTMNEYLKNGYKITGKNRMSYCAPEWIADKKEGGILLLDDWNRAQK